MKLYFDTFATPFGPFSVAVNDDGAITATAFGDETALRSRLPECHITRDTSALAKPRAQILAYAAGQRRTFELPLAPTGTAFQHSVWNALEKIPFGQTRSYGQLAAELGNAKASRAVGRANATNPICLIVPCHRVIGADGSLTGFAFGETIKRQLLDLERKHSARADPDSGSAPGY